MNMVALGDALYDDAEQSFVSEYESGGELDKCVLKYRKAADLGCREAQFTLWTFLHGDLCEALSARARQSIAAEAGSEVSARHWLEKSACLNYPPALNALADELYAECDYDASLAFTRKVLCAIDANVYDRSDALRRLARFYARGEGVAQDLLQANKFIRQAVALGFPAAFTDAEKW